MSTKQNSKSETSVPNVLESAQSAFVAKNYADVTMEEIAEAAGVTKGALYHHFASKEALCLEMMHADLQEKRYVFRWVIGRQAAGQPHHPTLHKDCIHVYNTSGLGRFIN